MDKKEIIVGIDLGTTNSEVAAFCEGNCKILGPDQSPRMLPSCVGISPSGELFVGEKARNQLLLYPELTVESVKRKMGTDEKLSLGKEQYSPEEISALILRELVQWASVKLGEPVKKAVITVPAYFSDTQREATRHAGELAGLEVVRILNEPTAASLAYGAGMDSKQTVMVYDLGGGTFDVSIVSIESDVTEVLASHGNNHLGGNDFDQLILERLVEEFQKDTGINLEDCHPAGYSRLRWAAEQAKRTLSTEPYAHIREESLATADGRPLHLDMELSRDEYESMIRPLVETTLESVSSVMNDAGKKAGDIDMILLAGGSTRTPLVRQMLSERTGVDIHEDIHPDYCVALGAGLLASRLSGHDIKRVLVDVSPYSFGPSHLGCKDGFEYPYCYRPIISRNTPLPVSRTERYFTAMPYQEAVEVEIFQGDDPDALKNLPVGKFRIEGLTPTKEHSEVLCKMNLDLDGILRVAAIEKRTGKSKYITINNALKTRDEKQLTEAQKRLRELYSRRAKDFAEMFGTDIAQDSSEEQENIIEAQFEENRQLSKVSETTEKLINQANEFIERSRQFLEKVHEQDREELINLHEQIQDAIESRDEDAIRENSEELKELLFFIEGR